MADKVHDLGAARKKRPTPKAAAPDWLARLNARHAVVRLGSRTVILDEREHEPPAFLKPDDFHLWYANDRVPAGTRDIPVSRLWLKHHDRRQYERVVFEPGRDAVDAQRSRRLSVRHPELPQRLAIFLRGHGASPFEGGRAWA